MLGEIEQMFDPLSRAAYTPHTRRLRVVPSGKLRRLGGPWRANCADSAYFLARRGIVVP